ncbi:MAG: CvpA family protein [Gemmataceae bacterium]
MYWLDTAILSLLGIGALLGLWSGLLWQIARIVSLGLAFAITVVANESSAEFLHQHLLGGAEPRVAQGVAYVAVFLAVYLITFYIARVLHSAVQASDLEWLDRLLGAAFGAAKIAIVIAILCLFATHSTHPAPQTWLKESRLAPVFAQGLQTALALLPEKYRSEMIEGVKGLREILGEKVEDGKSP